MVEDRISDGRRIAQLLSSELSGRETGPLASVAVVDADPDADSTPNGTVAYAVTHRDQRVGEVVLYPDRADLALALDADCVADAVRGPDLGVAPDADTRASTNAHANAADTHPNAETSAGVTLRIESGAAVKRAVDALVAGLESE